MSATWLPRVTAIGVLAFGSLPATAERFGYSPQYNFLAVGKGVAGIDFDNPRPACITFSTQTLKRSLGHTGVSIIYKQSDIDQALEVDSKASVGVLGQSGGGYLNLTESSSNHTVAFSIIIDHVKQANGTTMSAAPTINEPYATMLAQGKLEEFRQNCGDRYIQSEGDDVRIFAVINVFQEATKFNLNIATGGSANFNASAASVSASLGVDADFKKAVQNGAISVRTYYQGVAGLQDAAALTNITASDSIADIQSKVSSALAASQVTGQPASYDLTPYPGLPLIAALDDPVADFLNTVKTLVSSTTYEDKNIACLQQACDGRTALLSPADATLVAQYAAAYAAYEKQLRTIFSDCAAQYSTDKSKCDKGLIPLIPSRPDVYELVQVFPPFWSSFKVLVNKAYWLTPGEAGAVLATGPSLLAATQTIHPDATAVDVFADVTSPYFSVAQTQIPPPLAFNGASDIQAFGKVDASPLVAPQDFGFKTGLSGFGPSPGPRTLAATDNLFLLVHADTTNQCQLTKTATMFGTDIKTYDPVCYSPLVNRLVRSLSTNAMTFITTEWAKSKGPRAYGGIHHVPFSDVVVAKYSDQFGGNLTVPYGVYGIDYTSNGVLCGYQILFDLVDPLGNRIHVFTSAGQLH